MRKVKKDRPLDVSVVAQKLGVSTQTVRNWFKTKQLHGYQVNRTIRIYSASVDAILAQQTQQEKQENW